MRLILAMVVLLAACKKDDPAPAAKAAPVSLDASAAMASPDARPVAHVSGPDAEFWPSYPVGDAFVSTPVTPAQSQVAIPVGDSAVAATGYMFSPPGAAWFEILVAPNPPGDKTLDQLLTDGRDGLIEEQGATVIQDKQVTIDGAAGRDIRFSGAMPDGAGPCYGRQLIVAHKERVYSVTYIRPGADTSPDPIGDRFIDSFRFTIPH